MNDINELLRIIASLGGSATSDAIVEEYCMLHRMIVQPQYKAVVEKTLAGNRALVRRNSAGGRWEPKQSAALEYLYVSENRYFRTIRDAMLQLFNISVPLSHGYFKVDDSHSAWFPQPRNDNYDNVLSDDGKHWYEKPKGPSYDYEADNMLRYVFIHEKDGYRFTGVFKQTGIDEDRTHVYELVDDKVRIVKPRPYLIICRVAYMKYYNGITADDSPVNGGSYVVKNKDAMEKNNFHCYPDGNCYIYIETKYKANHTGEDEFAKSITIEQIDPSYKGRDSIDGVRVVLAAFSPALKKNVIVGWYDNATVYRNRIVEPDKTYMMKCSFGDAHLIPDADRSFEVPRAQGNDYGIGQSNFWYIQKAEAARSYEDQLVEHIESMGW